MTESSDVFVLSLMKSFFDRGKVPTKKRSIADKQVNAQPGYQGYMPISVRKVALARVARAILLERLPFFRPQGRFRADGVVLNHHQRFQVGCQTVLDFCQFTVAYQTPAKLRRHGT